MADGHLNKCKDCTKKDVREHRAENDSVREYDRRRGSRKGLKELQKYRNENPEKYKAHSAVNNALRGGRLFRPNCCEDCGKECKPHGHHDDYNKQLEVRWLCARCHAIFHAKYGSF